MPLKSFFLIGLLLFSIALAQGQKLVLKTFATGFDQPIGLENVGDDRLFVIEQKGLIQLIDTAGLKRTTPFLDIQDRVSDRGNEQGLLGLAFHPNYKRNGWFVLNYTKSGGNSIIALYKTSKDADVADPNSETILLEIEQPYANHNGGGIVFGPDGYLYIGMGDGGWAGDPKGAGQDKQALLGKMLRIKVEETRSYTVPKDNPYISDAAYRPEIWAMGLRNPWRFSFDPFNGNLWIADVGQNKWEEIDFQKGNSLGGENYGWNCREGAHQFQPEDCPSSTVLIDPVYEYANSNAQGCSVTGGQVYRGTRCPSLFGAYLFTDFCSGNIWRTDKVGAKFETVLIDQYKSNNYSSFGTDAAGELYLCERQSGNITRLTTKECKPVAHFYGLRDSSVWITGNVLKAGYGNGLRYEWFLNGTALNQSRQELVPKAAGSYSCVVKNLKGCSDTASIYIKRLVSTNVKEHQWSDAQISLQPAQQTLNIRLPEDWPAVESIEIVDVSGKKVWLDKTTPYPLKNMNINVSSLPNGSYLLKLHARSLEWTYPVSVKH